MQEKFTDSWHGREIVCYYKRFSSNYHKLMIILHLFIL